MSAEHNNSGPSGAAAGGAGAANAGHGGVEHLIKMANDIGHFFRAEPDRADAIAGIANHIDKFWTKRMREKLHAHLRHTEAAASGLEELPLQALRRLATHNVAVSTRHEPEGGDAG